MFRLILWRCTVFILCLQFINPTPDVHYNQRQNSERIYQLRQEKVAEFQSFLNTSADACENFYEYSSGNYVTHFKPYVDAYSQWNPLYNVIQTMKQNIEKYLHSDSSDGSDVDKKVRQFYRTCQTKAQSKQLFAGKLKQLVEEFGKMPVLEDQYWRESDFNWAQVVANINAKTNLGIIFQTKMTPDPYDNSITRATLMQQEFSLPKRIYYESHSFLDNREQVRSQIQTHLQEFLNVDERLAQQTATDIFNFEIDLAHGMQDLDYDKPNVLYELRDIKELQDQYLPAWNTVEHFATVLDLYPTRVMAQSTYLKNLYQVIQRTPKKTVANYIFYIYLKEYMSLIDLSCEDVARKAFPEYFENTMYHLYTTEEDRAYVFLMWEDIKSTFEDTLIANKHNWLTYNTRKLALEKINTVKFVVDSYEHIDFKYKYASLHLNDHKFLSNYHAILMLRGKEGRALVTKPPKFVDPPADGLVYQPEINTIHFPVAYLLPGTLWSTAYPSAINFGSVGTFIGHELIHGFDDLGGQFDKSGNFRSWWDNTLTSNFEASKACIINQYKNYKFRGVNMPAIQQQGENISDNVGIQLAYKAYMKWYKNASPTARENEIMPGLHYNNKQLFFFALGQALGGAYAESFTYDNDPHMPGEVRLKGTLSNMVEFAEAFNCRPGSVMNPMRRCHFY